MRRAGPAAHALPRTPCRARDTRSDQRQGDEQKKADAPRAEFCITKAGNERKRHYNDGQRGKHHRGMSSLQIVSIHDRETLKRIKHNSLSAMEFRHARDSR